MTTQLGWTKAEGTPNRNKEICFKTVTQETFLSQLVGYLLTQWWLWLCQLGMKMNENEVLVPLLREEAERETHRRDVQLYSSLWR